jgi:hypothetical protein
MRRSKNAAGLFTTAYLTKPFALVRNQQLGTRQTLIRARSG